MNTLLGGLACVGMLFIAGTIGCGATKAQLKTRAAFDLKCGEGDIELVKIDVRTYGVRGCGQQATYVENCNPNCTWILNTDSSQARQ